ncbi:uncharacterized protein LOC131356711 isoform X2 [Hemibagrus wyckioides]|uniref:uncharacterized protein LOC131356711 isoform X2 n=1 Tax=Hemibagrus wyckioides TaxID=337641 RepID=UPI00266BBC43|nr:uncharacterized protein LOC131356711 isoform X2 [Hemibagrus wyckioides]
MLSSHFREVFGKLLWDTSAGEQLYHLKQGTRSINDYTLHFRTLAAASGWDERTLLTTYHQGLEPGVRLQLATVDDSIGLESFIQPATRVSERQKLCLAEPRLSLPSPVHRHPKTSPSSTSLEPAMEPMQVEHSRLSPSEKTPANPGSLPLLRPTGTCIVCMSHMPSTPRAQTLDQPATSSLPTFATSWASRRALTPSTTASTQSPVAP